MCVGVADGDSLPHVALCITCPAGAAIAGAETASAAVECRVEGALITERLDPSSVRAFCAGNYRECPTWRRDKALTWATRRNNVDLVAAMDADPASVAMPSDERR